MTRTAPPPLPGIHDAHLITRNPISQDAWTAAWRKATGRRYDTDKGHWPPQLLAPEARVGTCTVHGCNGALVPTNPPEVDRRSVRWFQAVCTRCDQAYATHQPATPSTTAAAAAARDYQPPGGGPT